MRWSAIENYTRSLDLEYVVPKYQITGDYCGPLPRKYATICHETCQRLVLNYSTSLHRKIVTWATEFFEDGDPEKHLKCD